MNNTAVVFHNWVKRKLGYIKASSYCRSKWQEYGEKVIKRSLNDGACTNIQVFEELCEYYKKRQ